MDDRTGGVDTAIENALNKLFSNLLVEPNAVTWDVERWWVNRPGAQRGARASQGCGLSDVGRNTS